MGPLLIRLAGTAAALAPFAFALGVFFMSAVFAIAAARLLGTAIGPAMFIVGAGFAFCFALSTFLRMPAARKGDR